MDGILIKMNLKEKNIKLHNLVLAKKWTTLLATIVIKLQYFILALFILFYQSSVFTFMFFFMILIETNL
jgi:hypothetical protein